MTFLWCAYCQQFQGETTPFQEYEISHGLCKSCGDRGAFQSDEQVEKGEKLRQLQEELWWAGMEMDPAKAEAMMSTALTAGIRPVEVLVGLVTPALQKIGALWAEGKVTVADEHQFTSVCEKLVQQVEVEAPASRSPLEVLLVNAEGNYHTLGVRIAALWLQANGINAQALYPGLPVEDLKALLAKEQPHTVGISISLAWQQPGAEEMAKEIQSAFPGMKVVFGGSAVKLDEILVESGIPAAKTLQEFAEMLGIKSRPNNG